MMETNDELLKTFFDENRIEVEDKGFSQRVMKSLPTSKVQRLSLIWNIFSVILSVLIIYFYIGWDVILGALCNLFLSIISKGMPDNLTIILVSISATIGAYAIYKSINAAKQL